MLRKKLLVALMIAAGALSVAPAAAPAADFDTWLDSPAGAPFRSRMENGDAAARADAIRAWKAGGGAAAPRSARPREAARTGGFETWLASPAGAPFRSRMENGDATARVDAMRAWQASGAAAPRQRRGQGS
jgi:hypothetical protein